MAAKKLDDDERKKAFTVHLEPDQYNYISEKSRSGAWVREAIREKMEREKADAKKKRGARTGRS